MQIRCFLVSLIACWPLLPAMSASAQPKTTLEQKTIRAFEEYTGDFEKNIKAMVDGKKPFLWLQSQDSASKTRVRKGEILVFKTGKNVDIPNGIIHVWGVSAFVTGAKAEDVVALLLDYNRHKTVYPSVIDSRVLEKNGDTVRGYLRFRYKKALTVVLNTEHLAKLSRLSQGRYFIQVHSTRIAQVEDFGKPTEHELTVGKDSGFLWRLNSYWFVEPQKDGVFLECQSLTLTRSIPFGLSWLIKPFVESIPRDSLEELVESTRNALRN